MDPPSPRARSSFTKTARRSMSSLHGSLATTEDSNETASIDLEVYDSRERGSRSSPRLELVRVDARGSRRRARESSTRDARAYGGGHRARAIGIGIDGNERERGRAGLGRGRRGG